MRLLVCSSSLALSLASCAGPTPPVRVEIQERVVEVPRPCPAERPARPAPLARPLPVDPVDLTLVLTAKLLEYAGAGGYADRADTSLAICTREE